MRRLLMSTTLALALPLALWPLKLLYRKPAAKPGSAALVVRDLGSTGVFPLRIGLVLTQSLQPAAIGNGAVIVTAICDALGEPFKRWCRSFLHRDNGDFTALCAGENEAFPQATKSSYRSINWSGSRGDTAAAHRRGCADQDGG